MTHNGVFGMLLTGTHIALLAHSITGGAGGDSVVVTTGSGKYCVVIAGLVTANATLYCMTHNNITTIILFKPKQVCFDIVT